VKISQIPSILVVARFNEDISWLNEVKIPSIIYDKGELSENGVQLENNIGIDSDTHLTFIIDNYEKLPHRVFFSQGNPFDHVRYEEFFYWLGKWVEPGRVQSGAPVFRLAPINGHWNEESDNHSELAPFVKQTWTELFGVDMPEMIYYPAGQIFGYSAKRIKSRSLESWIGIRERLRNPPSDARCNHQEGRYKCACLSPFSAGCIERLWFYL
jgi:Protein of unknown function (DUF3431)